jgi:hypothetical protein
MTGVIETVWLFVRGEESVRMMRTTTPEGRVRLLVYGPGNSNAVHEFPDDVVCAEGESALERQLVAEGYSLERFTDRRSGIDRRRVPRGPDRRRD